jgi:maleylacetate reductase
MAIGHFVHQGSPQRVLFGSGTLSCLGEEVERLGIRSALVVSGREQKSRAGEIACHLGRACRAVFSGATMHTPVEITDEAVEIVVRESIDGIVAIGGGSTTGLAKAIAFRTNLPQVVVPTTYAGSEMTSILGETVAGSKKTRRDPRILPETVVYDVDLTMTLPARLSAMSGMNAIAHAVEGLYARDGNPILSILAAEGIRVLASALPRIASNPLDKDAREDALYGAWLCGTVLGGTSMALHHKLCHVLGGSFNLPHAATHAVVLPHAAAYNVSAAPEAMTRVAQALAASDAAGGLFDLARYTGAPTALRDIGMPGDELERAADLAVADHYWNPRPLDRTEIRALLDDAWHGRRPIIDGAASPSKERPMVDKERPIVDNDVG